MEIVFQEKLFKEIKYHAKEPIEIGHVVKGVPFEVRLRLSKPLSYNFQTGKLEFALYLVNGRQAKSTVPMGTLFPYNPPPPCLALAPQVTRTNAGPVPFEVIARVSAGDSSQCNLECRLYALSSQHNCGMFSLRARLVDPRGTDFVEAYTDAIYTSSTVDMINRRRHEATLCVTKETIKKGKRTRTDDIIDLLVDIEKTQAKQQGLLELIAGKAQDGFESALVSLVGAYDALAGSERPAKVRRLLATLPDARRVLSDLAFFVQEEPVPDQADLLSWTDPEIAALFNNSCL